MRPGSAVQARVRSSSFAARRSSPLPSSTSSRSPAWRAIWAARRPISASIRARSCVHREATALQAAPSLFHARAARLELSWAQGARLIASSVHAAPNAQRARSCRRSAARASIRTRRARRHASRAAPTASASARGWSKRLRRRARAASTMSHRSSTRHARSSSAATAAQSATRATASTRRRARLAATPRSSASRSARGAPPGLT